MAWSDLKDNEVVTKSDIPYTTFCLKGSRVSSNEVKLFSIRNFNTGTPYLIFCNIDKSINNGSTIIYSFEDELVGRPLSRGYIMYSNEVKIFWDPYNLKVSNTSQRSTRVNASFVMWALP